MIKCLKCNRAIPDDARLCPYCGTRVTDQQRITEKVYGDTLSNLKKFITKAPINMKKARVINWTKDEVEQQSKKPKSFYIIIIVMFITLSILMLFLLFGMFE